MVSRGTVERQARLWDALVREHTSPGDEPLNQVVTSGTILREPAAEQDIRAAEARLGVTLPPSYRAFLTVTNGAYADPEGVVTQRSVNLTRSQPPGLGLLPVEQIELLPQADPTLYEVWTDEVGPLGPAIQHDGDDVHDFDALRRGALLIGSAHDGATVLVRATRAAEWQLWIFQQETVTGYKSFGSWLRTVAYSLPLSALPDALDRYSRGDERIGRRIVRVRDPAAVPVLAAAMQSGISPYLIMNALLSVGTAEAALAIEPCLALEAGAKATGRGLSPDEANVVGRAHTTLGMMKPAAAGDLLARYGCHLTLWTMRRDPRAASLALADLKPPDYAGAVTLGWIGDRSYLPALVAAAAKATDPGGRYLIAAARHKLGDESVRSELAAMANDSQHPRQLAAQATLNRAQ